MLYEWHQAYTPSDRRKYDGYDEKKHNRLLFFGDIILSRWIKAKMHHATTKTAYTIPIIDHVLI